MKKKLEAFTVSATDTIRDAMLKITANRCRAVAVVRSGRVVGVVSDGDIRRAFLKDVLPMAPVEKIMNLNCVTSTERNPRKLSEISRRESLTLLPLVDKQNRLLDVHLAYEPSFGPARRARKRRKA